MSSSCSQDKVCAILTRCQCVFEEKSLSHSLNSKVHINDWQVFNDIVAPDKNGVKNVIWTLAHLHKSFQRFT